VSTSGYWAQWVSYIYNRYHSTNYAGHVNATGPTTGNPWGNPQGAWIGAFEYCNEPNYYSWVGHDATHCVVVNMMRTVDALVSQWGAACGLLAPATSDVPDKFFPSGTQDTKAGTTFTNDVLNLLNQTTWRPANYIAWSHHNYRDMLDTATSTTTSRFTSVANSLNTYNWRGGGDRNIWVTEGGYTVNGYGSAEQTNQSNAISRTWNAYKGNVNAVVFSQYQLNNLGTPNYFASGLTTSGSFNGSGQFVSGSPLTARATFANLT
jgi:hypothetical protein